MDKKSRTAKEAAEKELKARTKRAKKLLQDEDELEQFLERLEEKLKKIPRVGEQISSIPMLISLVRAYIKKNTPVCLSLP